MGRAGVRSWTQRHGGHLIRTTSEAQERTRISFREWLASPETLGENASHSVKCYGRSPDELCTVGDRRVAVGSPPGLRGARCGRSHFCPSQVDQAIYRIVTQDRHTDRASRCSASEHDSLRRPPPPPVPAADQRSVAQGRRHGANHIVGVGPRGDRAALDRRPGARRPLLGPRAVTPVRRGGRPPVAVRRTDECPEWRSRSLISAIWTELVGSARSVAQERSGYRARQ